MNTIGERVRELRTKKRLSMDALAKSIAIPLREKDTNRILAYKPTTSASISNIENDRHRPSLDMAIALAEFFQVSLDWLILGTGTLPEVSKGVELVSAYLDRSENSKKDKQSTEIAAGLDIEDKELDKSVLSDNLKYYIETYTHKEVQKQIQELFRKFLKEKFNS